MDRNQTGRIVFGIAVASAIAPADPLLAGDLASDGARANLLAAQPEEDADATEEAVPSADRWFLSGWDGSFELGLTGASGNTDRLSFRGAAELSKDTETSFDEYKLSYSYASSDGEEEENRAKASARHDWKIPESRWRVYVRGIFEYDEFQDWDKRVSIGPGVGYQAIKNDRTDLLLRAGLVLTREIGGSDNAWTPEGDLGFDFKHKLTERQSITASFDLYPSLKDFGPYRFTGDVAWMIEVDPEANLFLKIGAQDRYDSSPGPGKKRNDLDYYATVGWSF